MRSSLNRKIHLTNVLKIGGERALCPMDVVLREILSVSYTHLDVYKRQVICSNEVIISIVELEK